jgi:nitroreductase
MRNKSLNLFFLLIPILLLIMSSCKKQDDNTVSDVTNNSGNVEQTNNQINNTNEDAVLSNIFNRKSVRKFDKTKPVSKEMLTQLLKAGMAAPSGMNLQPWQFVVVTDRYMLDKLSEKLIYAKMLETATAAIIVCGDLNVKSRGDNPYCFWMEDCGAATENILLAVEAMGLGAVWTAVYPYQERMDWVTKCCGLPKEVVALDVIPIGYPDNSEVAMPKNKYDEAKIHWEKW